MLMGKEKLANSLKEIEKDTKLFEIRKANPHPKIQKLVGYTKSEKEEMCSTTFRINGLFEYIDSDLEYFITEKIKYK